MFYTVSVIVIIKLSYNCDATLLLQKNPLKTVNSTYQQHMLHILIHIAIKEAIVCSDRGSG